MNVVKALGALLSLLVLVMGTVAIWLDPATTANHLAGTAALWGIGGGLVLLVVAAIIDIGKTS